MSPGKRIQGRAAQDGLSLGRQTFDPEHPLAGDSKGSSLALILHIFFNMFVFVYSNYVHRTNTSTHSLPASIARSPRSKKF